MFVLIPDGVLSWFSQNMTRMTVENSYLFDKDVIAVVLTILNFAVVTVFVVVTAVVAGPLFEDFVDVFGALFSKMLQ